ncbi:hypothetical protein [Rhizobium binae]
MRGKKCGSRIEPEFSDPTPASLFEIAAYLDGQDWIGVSSALQHAF